MAKAHRGTAPSLARWLNRKESGDRGGENPPLGPELGPNSPGLGQPAPRHTPRPQTGGFGPEARLVTDVGALLLAGEAGRDDGGHPRDHRLLLQRVLVPAAPLPLPREICGGQKKPHILGNSGRFGGLSGARRGWGHKMAAAMGWGWGRVRGHSAPGGKFGGSSAP